MIDDSKHYSQVMAAAAFIADRISIQPQIGVILGTGQDLIPEGFITANVIGYDDIPHFPQPTVPGHNGRIVSGSIGDTGCLVFQGRFHYYEGHDPKTITLPVRVMAELGIAQLIVTNTAGGLNLTFAAGDLMVIADHINLIGANPLRGENREAWGPRFPDMAKAYSPRLNTIAQEAGATIGISLHRGVYIGIPGPSLETPAETRMLRMLGGDAVGMSTTPEVIAAVHAGMEVLGLSIIANVNNPEQMQPIRIDEVIIQVGKASAATRRLLAEVINRI